MAHCGPGTRNALGLAALAGADDIPVACGREDPLYGNNAFPSDWRAGADSLQGLTLPETGTVSDQTAVELLISTIGSSPQKVVLLTLGPLTNVAEALQQSPELVDNLEMIYIMGGAVDVPGNVFASGAAEWNIYVDPRAANIVLESGAPITLVPLDATSDVPVTVFFYDALKENYITPEAAAILDLFTGSPFIYQSASYFWDPLTAAISVNESLAAIETRKLRVVEEDGQENGHTKVTDDGVEVRVAVSADAPRFEQEFLSTLNGGADVTIARPNVPQARAFLAMAYDSESDRVILFGGNLGRLFGPSGRDTWSYDPTTNRWTQVNPSIRPSARGGHDMVYDTESDRIILFGGVNASFAGNRTTWAYDFNTDTWTRQAPGPPAREGPRMAYDAESDRVILFGGQAATGGRPYLNDTWAYDFNTDSWTEMKPSISPRGEWYHTMTYDAESDRVLMWRGSPDKSVWAYDFNTNTWTKNEKAECPSKGRFGALVYDSESDRSILYGGGYWQYTDTTDETWAYDYNTNAWTKMEPSETPGKLTGHAMVYNPTLDLVVLFGGRAGSGDAYTAETWTYDLNSDTWTNVTLGQE